MHIADRYVGLPFRKGGRDFDGVDCFGLVRLFLATEAKIILPRFDECDSIADTIAHEKLKFASVPREEARRFDVVIAYEPVRAGLNWIKAQNHMGVLVEPKLVLHITNGTTSRIDPLSSLAVADIRRVL